MADMTIEAIEAEERELQFPAFDAGTAWRLGARLRAAAAERKLPIAIEVGRTGQVLFFAAMAGATPDNAEWIRRKRNVVQRFQRASLAMRLSCEARGVVLATRYGLDERDYAASGGGFPIIVRGAGVIGAAIVSGLPDVEDHRLVVDAIRATIAEGA
jgi:uncharacterized protein (UPF0303 family)